MKKEYTAVITGDSLLCESIEVLRNAGFRLIALEEGFLDGRNGHTLQLNGIFGSPSRRRSDQILMIHRDRRCAPVTDSG